MLFSVLPYLQEFRGRVALALGFLLLAKISTVVMPVVLKHIVDALDRSEVQIVAVPLALLLFYGVLRLSGVVFGELRDSIFGRVTERIMRRVGLTVFRHLHSLELAFHLERRTGGIARDIERGTNGISFLLRFMIFNIVPTIVEIGLVATILGLTYSIEFALITLGSVLLYIAFSVMTTQWRTKFVREANEMDSKSNTRAIDSLLNYETVKYFANEEFEAARYDEDLAAWENARRKNRLSLAFLNSGQALIISLGITAMLILAAQRVAQGSMTLGDFAMVNAYMIQLFLPLNFLGFVYREMRRALIDIERLFALLNTAPKVVDDAESKPLNVIHGHVEFKSVSFAYHPDRPILNSLSFRVEAGKKIAIVGSSGAGKSTIARLLFRFYDVNSGSICIDGQNIQQVTQHSLRSAIGVVPQDTVLFNDTIYNNIAYAKPDATEAEVKQAAELAYLNRFIDALPEGYQTMVGERGLKVSGGEKQRIAIARTLLKDPAILLFDEATSSLDSVSEQAILQAMKAAAANRTSIVIAHRLSTVIDADHIIVLDHGEIAEQGTHGELLTKNGRYAELWRMQQHDGAD